MKLLRDRDIWYSVSVAVTAVGAAVVEVVLRTAVVVVVRAGAVVGALVGGRVAEVVLVAPVVVGAARRPVVLVEAGAGGGATLGDELAVADRPVVEGVAAEFDAAPVEEVEAFVAVRADGPPQPASTKAPRPRAVSADATGW